MKLAATQFLNHFGYAPRLTVAAPGRVNLIGEHTDYNDGFVLPCAIDYHTQVSISGAPGNQVRVLAADWCYEEDIFSLDAEIEPSKAHPWANYVRGVVKHLLTRGLDLGGCNLLIAGNVPQGAGLSSSAALEVALGTAFNALFELDLTPDEIAKNGQIAENQFVGCNCGIMDQLISARGKNGHALLIDCRSYGSQLVAIPQNTSIVIVDSKVKRGLVSSHYNLRREQCESAARHFKKSTLRELDMAQIEAGQAGLDSVAFRRARHVISENARTLSAAKALAAGDLLKIGELMADSHASLRYDFEVTHPAVDALVEIISPVIGSFGGVRMTGGGFGGCVVALVPDDLVREVCGAVEKNYEKRTGLSATTHVTHPVDGAHRIL